MQFFHGRFFLLFYNQRAVTIFSDMLFKTPDMLSKIWKIMENFV